MTASDERLIGRAAKIIGGGGLAFFVGAVLWVGRTSDAVADVEKRVGIGERRDSLTIIRQAVTEKRVDSLLIELRHLPNAVADTLAARERRSR